MGSRSSGGLGLVLIFSVFVGAALPTLACGRWPQARTYQVQSTASPDANYLAVQEVVTEKKYKVIERSDDTRTLKVRAHIDETSESRVSTITISVGADGGVSLVPGGFLVRDDGTIHRRLDEELADLEKTVAGRLIAGSEASDTPAASSTPESAAAGATPAPPTAWLEPAADTARWGPGNFTCLPLHIPPADAHLLALRLSTGELASVTLSLAYDAALCRSPAACVVADGCPALGIGDTDQVQALAQRMKASEVGTSATLLYKGQPAVVLDLGQHGSISQALGQGASPASASP